MKTKLSSKVMISYLVVLIITFTLTIILSNVVLERVLRKNEEDKLRDQGRTIVELLRKERANDNIQRAFRYFSLLNMDSVTDADIYIYANKTILYQSTDGLKRDELIGIVNSGGNNTYVVSRTPILSSTRDKVGQVILVSDVSNIQSIKRAVNKALIIAMIIAMFISFVISFWIQFSITKPLKTLIKEMRNININNTKQLTPINSGDEIEELYNVYNSMLERIIKNSEGIKRFFQNTSHELKTPLMSIQGYAEAIKDNVVTGEEVDDSLDLIIEKSQKLKKIVEETIYLSKLESLDIEYNFENILVNEYLNSYIEDYKLGSSSNSSIDITYNNKISEDYYSILDTDKFNSVLNNILDNGLRYAKSLIKVELSKRDDYLSIKIIDDGNGFENNENEKIFERFYKGNKGQTGIGLAIAYTIVKQHKGKIKADNHISGGAIFEISLPIIKI